MDDLLALIKGRRSVRRFTGAAIPNDTVEKLLEAMRWAPSAGNAQPYRIHLVRDRALKGRLATAALGQAFIAEAPLVLVIAAELAEAQRAYGTRGVELYSLQDTAAAIQNLLLAAHAAGLGACWIGAFRERSVAEALSLPTDQRPIAVVPVGVPAESPAPPRRKALRELTTWH